MPLYLKNNCKPVVFLHIPKTGGSTIGNWLNAECGYSQLLFSKEPLDGMKCTPQHLGIQDVTALISSGFPLETSYVFTVVRNPFDRLKSEFFYRIGLNQIRLGKAPEKCFSYWVNDVLSKATKMPEILDNHLRPQCYFVSENVHVFKLESGVKAILETVARENNQAAPDIISSKKISNKRHVIWSKSAIQRVQEFYKADFEQFGYEFEYEKSESPSFGAVTSITNYCVYHVRNSLTKFVDGEI